MSCGLRLVCCARCVVLVCMVLGFVIVVIQICYFNFELLEVCTCVAVGVLSGNWSRIGNWSRWVFFWCLEFFYYLFTFIFILVSQMIFPNFNPQREHCFSKFLKKRRQFHCTGLLGSTSISRRQKFDFFIQNLVQNLMNLFLSSKSDRK